jgi:hypothetical protein
MNPSDRQVMIKATGKRALMREARIAMRTIGAAWVHSDLADEEAAERIVSRAGRSARMSRQRSPSDLKRNWMRSG